MAPLFKCPVPLPPTPTSLSFHSYCHLFLFKSLLSPSLLSPPPPFSPPSSLPSPPSSLPSPPLSPSSLPYFCPSLDAIDPNAHPAFQASHDLKDVITRALRRKSVGDEEEVDGRRVPGMRKTLSIKLSLMTPVKPMLVSDRMQNPFSPYSESSVIQTSIIRILNYLNHKITLHMTCGLCNYRTNAHTQYIQSVHFQSHACFLCLKMAELLHK